MSPRRGAIVVAAAASLVVAAALGTTLPHLRAGARPPALPAFGELPPFALLDHRGEPFTQQTMAGRVWIADFIFTRCAGQCPLMSQRMAALQEALRDEPGVRLVSFSVDPVHDTPPRLAAYAQQVRADGERWRFVTGELSAITALAQDGFHLGILEGQSPEEPIGHSSRVALIDARGRIRGYYGVDEPAGTSRLLRSVRRLLREAP